MSKSCTLLAHVRRPNGEIVESRLFKDLLHYTSDNRKLSKKYYAIGTNQKFLDEVRDSELYKEDENGEITFSSLRALAEIDIKNDTIVQVLNDDFKSGIYSYAEALKKIQEFNDNSPWADTMMATMQPVKDGKYFVSVVPQTRTITDTKGKTSKVSEAVNEKKKLFDVVRNQEVENKLKALLRSYKVSVDFLEGDRQGGRYSTENIDDAVQGLYGLIQINEAGNTTEALAEEAGHFAVGALGNNPLVQRLQSLLSSEAAQREVLGDEEYENTYLGKRPSREVAGRLVGRALQRKLDSAGPVKVLANRVANLAKRVFARITNDELRYVTAKAEQIANKIAYQFVEKDSAFSVKNALQIRETMYNDEMTANQKIYKRVFDEYGRMVKQLEAIADDSFSGQMKADLGSLIIAGINGENGQSAFEMSKSIADTFAFDGIVQAFVNLTDYLGPGKEIDQLLNAVDPNNPSDFYNNMARNGRYLRQARVFIRSAAIILDTIGKALDEGAADRLVLANGSTLDDIRYQDEYGTWHSMDLRGLLNTYTNWINGRLGVLQRLQNKEVEYFTKFCENFYGSKYINTTVGILWKDIRNGNNNSVAQEKTISLDDLVKGNNMDDIDIFHRYLGSMANNPDIIGQIVDKMVKTSNKTADDLTIKYQERLMILKARAEAMGFDVEDIVEKDEFGVPTGNMITPPAQPTENGNTEEDFICRAYMEVLETNNPADVPAVDNTRWEKERSQMIEDAKNEFKEENPDWEDMNGMVRGQKWDDFFKKRMKDWNKENSVKVEVTDEEGNILYVKWVPDPVLFKSDKWEQIEQKYSGHKGSDSVRMWMADYMKIKKELDSYMPVGATISYRLPQFKGTFANSLRNSAGLQSGPFKKFHNWRKTFGRRVILESFVETAEDEDFGSLQTVNSEHELAGIRMDYEDERAARLPVFGINKLTNMKDLSTDIFHSTLAYASMATSYHCMSNVVDALEVGRQALYNREIKGKDTWGEKGGRFILSKFRRKKGEYEMLEYGSKNRAYGRYIKFLDKQVYGITTTYFGIPLKNGKRLLASKIVQNINSLGGRIFLKGNVLGGMVNTGTGAINIFKEAATGDYFNVKDWYWAHRYYWRYFPQLWTPGQLRQEDKLHLFLAQMNTSSNNREKFRSWHTERTWYNNFYRSLGYLPYSAGDHYMQAMSYLSVAHGTSLYDTDGSRSCNLWEAFESVENTDEKGRNFSEGNTLKFQRFCPLNEKDIHYKDIEKEGVFLKEVARSTTDFEDWLIYQDEDFKDEVYKKDHPEDYINYRRQYDALSKEDLMQFKAEKYQTLKDILKKTEQYLSTKGPFSVAPVYTPDEEAYLRYNGIQTGQYADIIQLVQKDIYNMIWTKADESSYMDKCRETNDRLHGIYNEQDKTAWHQQWYTNAFLAMKGWVLGYIESMYSNNHYSVALGKNTEGFVQTAGKIAAMGLSNVPVVNWFVGGDNKFGFRDLLISMIAPWSSRSMRAMKEAGFSEEQNFNARRMAMSVYIMALLWALRALTARGGGGGGDDDDDDDLMAGITHYLAMRLMYEQEALIYVPETIIQSGQILDFMPVGVSALWDVMTFGYEGYGAVFGSTEDKDFYYQKDDRKDRYEEGDTKFYHHLIRLTPYWKSWWALWHPYDAADNYNFGRKLRVR